MLATSEALKWVLTKFDEREVLLILLLWHTGKRVSTDKTP
jgi:hypothetical protein